MAPAKRQSGWGFLVIWEFTVRAGQERTFEQVYGPEGDWANLFRKDSSYLGTELVREVKGARKYLTLDYWTSERTYNTFRQSHAVEYKAIDAKCEALTESEREIGRYAKTP
jgi:heme-degrading monooxygenase HmoA